MANGMGFQPCVCFTKPPSNVPLTDPPTDAPSSAPSPATTQPTALTAAPTTAPSIVPTVLPTDEKECSGHGILNIIGTNKTKKCLCDMDWSGPICATHEPYLHRASVGPTAVPTLKNYMPDATLELDGDVSSMTPAMLQKAKMAIAEHMGIPVEEVEIGVNAGSVTVAMKIHRDDGNPMAKKFADDVRSGKIDIGNFFEGFSLAGSETSAPTVAPTEATYAPSTLSPTDEPTAEPTITPTSEPSVLPTPTPTEGMASSSSSVTTEFPTPAPSFTPSDKPTAHPTLTPSQAPTFSPMPGGRTFIKLQGSMDDMNPEVIQKIQADLASKLGIKKNKVLIEVMTGSIILKVEFLDHDEATADEMQTKTLMDIMHRKIQTLAGFKIEGVNVQGFTRTPSSYAPTTTPTHLPSGAPTESPSEICVPGRAIKCACSNGNIGGQSCLQTGLGYSPCVCTAEKKSFLLRKLQCVPGKATTCPCLDGSEGTQSCLRDGSGFTDCKCEHEYGLPNRISSASSSSSSSSSNGAMPLAAQATPGAFPLSAALNTAAKCTPGRATRCPCPGGTVGAQACAPDGRSYGACDCSAAAQQFVPQTVLPTMPPTLPPTTLPPTTAAPSKPVDRYRKGYMEGRADERRFRVYAQRRAPFNEQLGAPSVVSVNGDATVHITGRAQVAVGGGAHLQVGGHSHVVTDRTVQQINVAGRARVHVPGGAPVHVKGAPVQVGGTSHVEVAQGNHLYVHNARNTVVVGKPARWAPHASEPDWSSWHNQKFGMYPGPPGPPGPPGRDGANGKVATPSSKVTPSSSSSKGTPSSSSSSK